MNDSTGIPNDVNGNILRKMLQSGDDFSRSRTVDFCHVFSERRQALAFAEIVDDKELEVCISYNDQAEMWDVIVKRYMIPTHQDITSFEQLLATKAESLGGKGDGWGYIPVKKHRIINDL